MNELTDSQLLRYARNILLPELDIDGQSKLLNSRIAVVGAGGLGAPVIQYLAAAGVGQLSVIDGDVVDETNLQRQVIFNTSQVGQKKSVSAAQFVNGVNSDIRVTAHSCFLDSDTTAPLLAEADLVVIGTDNLASRYLANDYCQQHQVPLVNGAAIGLSGQVTSFDFRQHHSPCLRCLYHDQSQVDLSCASAGVLGPVVGVIGSVMASEAIKLLLRFGNSLHGRLWTIDLKDMSTMTLGIARRVDCNCNQAAR